MLQVLIVGDALQLILDNLLEVWHYRSCSNRMQGNSCRWFERINGINPHCSYPLRNSLIFNIRIF